MRLSQNEWVIMNLMWELGRGSVRDVHDRIPPGSDWAYTTVKTMLNRLADKGAVRVEKRGNVSVFSPLIAQDATRQSALRNLVDRVFDGAFGSMMQCLLSDEQMSPAERAELLAMLEAEDSVNKRSNEEREGDEPNAG